MKYIGAENEYTIFFDRGKGKKRVKTINFRQALNSQNAVALEDILFEAKEVPFSAWLKNGGKIYPDASNTEYSSPECESVEELILAEKTGEIIIRKMFSDYDQEKLFILKRTMSEELKSGTTAGSHENYGIDPRTFGTLVSTPDPKLEPEQTVLVNHLITRIIYTGAGHVQSIKKTKVPKIRFLLSPRAHFITRTISNSTRSDRALINQKNESLISTNLVPLARLHLICGDMNRSDWSLYLKYGTTALLLNFLEIASDKEIINLANDLFIEHPIEKIRTLSSAPQNSSTFFIEQLREAATYQLKILKTVEKYASKIARYFEDTENIMHAWHRALTDKNFGEDKLDWRIKKNVIESAVNVSLSKISELRSAKIINKIRALDISYHRVGNHDLFTKLAKNHLIKQINSEETIAKNTAKSPEGRASRRVEILQYILDSKLKEYLSLDWHHIELKSLNRSFHVDIPLDNKNINQLKQAVDEFRYKIYKHQNP